jgi:uncharacterized membrane protein YkvA (DUF1232 family)
MKLIESWKIKARALKVQTIALYYAMRDPRVPWYAKAWGAVVVAYAFSPIDLIPDFIPVLGYLDDLVLIPLGVALTLRMIPPAVMAECQARAEASQGIHRSWIAAAIIILVWLLAIYWLARPLLCLFTIHLP